MWHFLKSAGVVLLLSIAAMLAFLICLFTQFFSNSEKSKSSGRTVLLTGGKMTKCLQLARMFKSQGDIIIVAETAAYKYSGTRFSNCVDHYIIIPEITGAGEAFCNSLIKIALDYKVDLFVPVSSPKSAYYEALAGSNFPKFTRVFHPAAAIIAQLDNKHEFIALAQSYGLSVPESIHITDKDQLLNFKFLASKKYILKKLDYDPVYRLDLTPLPHLNWQDRVAQLPINASDSWVLQQYITGREICVHTTVQDGTITMYICCDSSPFQVNYKMLQLPQVKDWVTTFVKELNVTGQLSFDFIIDKNETVLPIECNPRTHSAITLFHNQLDAVTAYYKNAKSCKEPNSSAGHTYWLYHEIHRLLIAKSINKFNSLWSRIITGKEAVYSSTDPWPFFYNNHISIPYQIVKNLTNSKNWTSIDFNIGKLITPGGD